MVYDSNLDNQYTAMRKMVNRWFGPYIVLHAFDNATYKLCGFDGIDLKILIVGKQIKLFRKKEANMVLKDLVPKARINKSDGMDDEE